MARTALAVRNAGSCFRVTDDPPGALQMSRARSGYPSRSCEQDYVADEPVLGVLIVGPILVGRLRSKMSSRLKPALFVQKKSIIANNIDNKSRSRRSLLPCSQCFCWTRAAKLVFGRDRGVANLGTG